MSNRTCCFCRLAYHLRNRCPAKEAKCFTCGKVGHFSKVCRSRASGRHTNQVLRKTASSYSDPSPVLCTISAACPASLLPASLPVTLNGTKVTALVDSGSSESYVNSNICDKLNLQLYPTPTHQVQMASTAVKIKSKGFCLVDIVNNGIKFPETRLNAFENLCSDVILGLDFQSQYQRLIFQFSGSSPDLLVSREFNCTLAAAQATEVSLFSNLSSDVKPIATRSRRYGENDRAFIDNNI